MSIQSMTSLGRVGRILAGSIDVAIEPQTSVSSSNPATPSSTITTTAQASQSTMQSQSIIQPQPSTDTTGSTVTLVGASDYNRSEGGSTTGLDQERDRQASPVQKISFNGEWFKE